MNSRWMKWGAVAAVIVLVAVALVGVVPRLNPFGTDTIDRSHPAVLKALRDLSQYHAAAGDYEVVVDIEKDVKWVPAALAGERTLFVAAGTVNAYIDFGRIVEDMIVMSPDRKSVQVTIPKPVLDKPNLNNERSYVFSQERGLIDRLNAVVDTPNQQPFYVAAEQRIAAAAKESGLSQRATDNTRAMLTGMLQALGFQVTIVEKKD